MKKILTTILVLLAIGFLVGCAGTKAQRITYTATDAFGVTVHKATMAFEDYEVAKAFQALGAGATRAQITEWVHNDPAWRAYAPMKDQYNAAFVAWCEVNAAFLASGTNAVSVITAAQFKQNAITAAVKLTGFIVQFVPTIKTVQP